MTQLLLYTFIFCRVVLMHYHKCFQQCTTTVAEINNSALKLLVSHKMLRPFMIKRQLRNKGLAYE